MAVATNYATTALQFSKENTPLRHNQRVNLVHGPIVGDELKV
jgi:hypothetical protein